MKKIYNLILVLILVLGISLLTGCGKENKKVKKEEVKATVATMLKKQFEEEVKDNKDIVSLANNISKNKVIEVEVNVEELNEDSYITGFKEEIKDFDNGVVIRPMIGNIPFIAYIFEVKDSNSFADKLRDTADLRWNICTEAKEMEISVVDNKVFFVMAPDSFE